MRPIRTIVKGIGWLAGVVVGLALLWFVANRLSDPAPSPAHQALAASRSSLPDSSNAALGILGLTAPTGSNFMQYGAQIKTLVSANAPQAQIQAMIDGPDTLRPTVTGQQTLCWLDPAWTTFKDCLPFDRAPEVLRENKELIERYRSLYDLEGFEATDILYNDAGTVVVRLVVAEMHLDMQRGDFEGAYRKWYRQLRFARRNLRSTDTWVGKAVGLVTIGMTIPVLDSLLYASPEIAKKHRAQLEEVLRPDGTASFDPDGIVRAEFHLLRRSLNAPPVEIPGYGVDRLHWLAFHFGQKNRMLNTYAAFAPDYAASLRLPWAEMERTSGHLLEKQRDPDTSALVLDPIGSMLSIDHIQGQLKAREMIRQMHFLDGKLRLATLLVRLASEEVPQPEIPKILAVDPALFDPFSSAPARWDSKDGKIYFVDPRDKCTVATWFRVRNLKRPPSKSSVVDTNAC